MSNWVPDADGDLQPPSSILFDSLDWPADPFPLSKIHFKKPIVEELAREAGFELDMLKKWGLTSTAELMARLNVDDLMAQSEGDGSESEGASMRGDAEHGITTESGDKPKDDTPQDHDLRTREAECSQNSQGMRGEGQPGGAHERDDDEASSHDGSRRSPGAASDGEERTFVSYIATRPVSDDESGDLEGIDHAERLA